MLRKLFGRSCDPSLSYGILHNRKTGGTALRDVIKQHVRIHPDASLQSFGHSMTFPRFNKKYPQAKVIFFIREPLSRFVSGFYSRLRQGQPRYNTPWTKQEAKAFSYFKTPNALAEALSSEQFAIRRRAMHAMRAIGHVRHTYVEFLGSVAFLEKHAHKIFLLVINLSLMLILHVCVRV